MKWALPHPAGSVWRTRPARIAERALEISGARKGDPELCFSLSLDRDGLVWVELPEAALPDELFATFNGASDEAWMVDEIEAELERLRPALEAHRREKLAQSRQREARRPR